MGCCGNEEEGCLPLKQGLIVVWPRGLTLFLARPALLEGCGRLGVDHPRRFGRSRKEAQAL